MKRVVLVRPKGPANVGAALRAATNFGPAELCLVVGLAGDLRDSAEFEQASHGVPDPSQRVRVCPDLETALADCSVTVGFTARMRDHRVVRDWRELREPLGAAATSSEGVALVFGNEESGLSTAEADLLQQLAWLPTGSEHTSINLAMAVGIVLFDLLCAAHPPGGESRLTAINTQERRLLTAHVADTLGALCIRKAARRDITASVQRIFARAPLETRDARAWHAIMRRLEKDAPGEA